MLLVKSFQILTSSPTELKESPTRSTHLASKLVYMVVPAPKHVVDTQRKSATNTSMLPLSRLGIDYFKYDYCYVPSNWTDEYDACLPDQWQTYGPFPNGTCAVTNTTAPAGYDWGTSNTAKRYGIMRDALLAQNRTILYSKQYLFSPIASFHSKV